VEAFVSANHKDYQTPVDRLAGEFIETRRIDSTWLCLCRIDGWPALLRVEEVIWAQGRAVVLMQRASGHDRRAWANAQQCSLEINLNPQCLAGRYALTTLTGVIEVEFVADGSIVDQSLECLGTWLPAPGAIWILGLEGVRVGMATQFQCRRGGWRLSGWGWKSVEERVTFSLTPIAIGQADGVE
jgi:hypothetical protein